MTEARKAIIKRVIWRATEKFKGDNGLELLETPAPELTEPGKRLLKSLDSINKEIGNDKFMGAMAAICEELSGAPAGMLSRRLEKGKKGKALLAAPKMCALIPIQSYDGHNYPLNAVAVFPYGGYSSGIRMQGDLGNNITGISSVVRPATLEELDRISEKQFAQLEAFIVFPEDLEALVAKPDVPEGGMIPRRAPLMVENGGKVPA